MAQKSQHWNSSKEYAGEGNLLVSIEHCASLESLAVVETHLGTNGRHFKLLQL
jgi:hypothetical protein